MSNSTSSTPTKNTATPSPTITPLHDPSHQAKIIPAKPLGLSNSKYDGLDLYPSRGVIDGQKDGFECRADGYAMCVVRNAGEEYGQRVCCASRALVGSRMLAHSLESCNSVVLGSCGSCQRKTVWLTERFISANIVPGMTTNGAAAGLGQKALLAKKFAKAKYVAFFLSKLLWRRNLLILDICFDLFHSKPTISPTDQLQSPCTAKLSNAKQRHFTK